MFNTKGVLTPFVNTSIQRWCYIVPIGKRSRVIVQGIKEASEVVVEIVIRMYM